MTSPTLEDLEAAFARVRGEGWPASLHDLQLAATRLALVNAAAGALARGQRVLARESLKPATATPTPPEHLDAAAPMPRLEQAWHFPAKRQLAHGLDLKRLAAGDRDD